MSALKNAEQVFNKLMKNPGDIVITDDEAKQIFKKFRGSKPRVSQLKTSHKAFLQAALIAAVDGSATMGYVEGIFKSAFMKPVFDAKSFKKVLKKLAKATIRQYFKNAKRSDILDAAVYSTTVKAISYQCAHYFRSINQGLDI